MKISTNYGDKRVKTTFIDCPPNAAGRTSVEVVTYKSGPNVITRAQWGEHKQEDGYSTFSFIMYGDENNRLHVESFKRITDAIIRKQHAAMLDVFMKSKGWEVQP